MTTELRYWRDSDVESLTKLCNETDRTFLTDALPFPYTAEYAAKRIEYCKQEEGKGGIYRAITVDGKVAGNIDSVKDGRRKAIVGYYLSPDFCGRGVATSALKEFCRIAAANGIKLLTARVCRGNSASVRVLEKNGFSQTGILKDYPVKKTLRCDVLIFKKKL